MNWTQIGYALACVVVPIGWGLVIVWISNRMDRRLLAHGGKSKRSPHPIEYHI